MSRRSEPTDPLIHGYRLELSEPPCIPGADTWNAKAILEDSIVAVLPYLNAVLRGADYHHDSEILIWNAPHSNQGFLGSFGMDFLIYIHSEKRCT